MLKLLRWLPYISLGLSMVIGVWLCNTGLARTDLGIGFKAVGVGAAIAIVLAAIHTIVERIVIVDAIMKHYRVLEKDLYFEFENQNPIDPRNDLNLCLAMRRQIISRWFKKNKSYARSLYSDVRQFDKDFDKNYPPPRPPQ